MYRFRHFKRCFILILNQFLWSHMKFVSGLRRLCSIEKAMLFISHHHYGSFIIYTDSESSTDAIKSTTHPPIILSILKPFRQLTSHRFNILFCWMPGHMGILGNENTDKAAKHVLNILYHQIPFTDIKHIIKNCICNNWQENWDSERKQKIASY